MKIVCFISLFFFLFATFTVAGRSTSRITTVLGFWFLFAGLFFLEGFYDWGSLALLGLITGFGGVAYILAVITRRFSWLSKRPLLHVVVGLAALVLMLFSIAPLMWLGLAGRDHWFLSHLSEFAEKAEAMEKVLPHELGEIKERKLGIEPLPFARRTMSGLDKEGVATIVFVTSSGWFPIYHNGYMYRSDDRPYTDIDGLRIRERVAPHWFALNTF